eukprot:CAMPEP_0170164408 /NCGR_PEP_ID=MMETSP0033_2-20121228/78091_1 /TAXON_ID=195969 /ORGANISM="Dolichomastix tenuilepis, Strain CCMP3274" /LENGTH=260 /DNA_ID=CAMNT_0010402053 /DNA_START=362 /DNA_END=1142 /DNA_ORIENTATION=+
MLPNTSAPPRDETSQSCITHAAYETAEAPTTLSTSSGDCLEHVVGGGRTATPQPSTLRVARDRALRSLSRRLVHRGGGAFSISSCAGEPFAVDVSLGSADDALHRRIEVEVEVDAPVQLAAARGRGRRWASSRRAAQPGERSSCGAARASWRERERFGRRTADKSPNSPRGTRRYTRERHVCAPRHGSHPRQRRARQLRSGMSRTRAPAALSQMSTRDDDFPLHVEEVHASRVVVTEAHWTPGVEVTRWRGRNAHGRRLH